MRMASSVLLKRCSPRPAPCGIMKHVLLCGASNIVNNARAAYPACRPSKYRARRLPGTLYILGGFVV